MSLIDPDASGESWCPWWILVSLEDPSVHGILVSLWSPVSLMDPSFSGGTLCPGDTGV